MHPQSRGKAVKKLNGALVQLVRIHACHAWGHEFESRTHRKANSRLKQALKFKDFRVFYFSPLRQKIAVLGNAPMIAVGVEPI